MVPRPSLPPTRSTGDTHVRVPQQETLMSTLGITLPTVFNVPAIAQQNPFVASAEDQPTTAEAGYVMIASTPAVDPRDVESDLEAIEVCVMWGQNVLFLEHRPSTASFVLGEDAADYVMPAEQLGAPRVAILEGGAVRVPAGATAVLYCDAERKAIAGPGFATLSAGTTAIVTLATGFSVKLSSTKAGRTLPSGFLASLSEAAHKHIGVSLLAHVGIIASLAFFMPKMSDADADAIDRDSLMLMQKMLNASAEKEQEPREDRTTGDVGGESGGGTGERHRGPEGKLGSTEARQPEGRYQLAGPKDNMDPVLARKQAIDEARDWGMLGILLSNRGAPDQPASPWGADTALGKDERSIAGNMWGRTLDDAIGSGGLGFSGNEEGGGGDGTGIGLDKIGRLGNGAGGGPGTGIGNCKSGPCDGTGIGTGRPAGGHVPKGPSLRPDGDVKTGGHLPAEVIKRIVQQNFGRFRACYESGLRTNPSLTGRVATKFVIGREGDVTLSADAGSDLPDRQVVQCVVRNFQNLSFPKPESGIVTVIYPILFTPGE